MVLGPLRESGLHDLVYTATPLYLMLCWWLYTRGGMSRELGGSTNTSITSLDNRQMLLSCDLIRLCRNSLTSALTRLRSPIGVSRQERRHGGWRKALYYDTLGFLTLRFCHFFQEIFWGQQMRSRSLPNNGSSTRREAHQILLTWLMVLLPMLMSSWVRRWWALSSGLRPCAMLGSRSHRFWPGGEAGGRGGGNNSMRRTRSRITCSCCLRPVFYFSYIYDIGSYVCHLMTCSRTLALTMLVLL